MSVSYPTDPHDGLVLRLERLHLLEPFNKICTDAGVLIEQVFSPDRRAHIARARSLIWLWLRQEMHWSYPAIGDLFDRDHSTVMAGVARVGQELGLVEYAAKGKKSRRAA